ncbi:MAG: chemotaxis protein CheB [Chryseosolibacter sp.]
MMKYDFYIAALGASAGGLKALHDFFSRVSDSQGIAYVVALHSLRDAKSHLKEILSRITRTEVTEITQRMKVLPNKIYVHPPGMKVSIKEGIFILTERDPEEKINKTIDHLFVSIAEDAGEKAIGIIMSGTGSDGTEGFKAIEGKNGTTIVQNPDTAEFDGMPLHSIRYDHPDHILNPLEMPSFIGQLLQRRAKGSQDENTSA